MLLLALLAGCATREGLPHCFDCGTVRSVEVINPDTGQAAGAGTLGGSPGRNYRVTIDMDNGSTRSVVVTDYAGVDRGMRVRVIRGREIEVVDPADETEP